MPLGHYQLPRTAVGKEYIIVEVDYMTRWEEAAPTSTSTAKDPSARESSIGYRFAPCSGASHEHAQLPDLGYASCSARIERVEQMRRTALCIPARDTSRSPHIDQVESQICPAAALALLQQVARSFPQQLCSFLRFVVKGQRGARRCCFQQSGSCRAIFLMARIELPVCDERR